MPTVRIMSQTPCAGIGFLIAFLVMAASAALAAEPAPGWENPVATALARSDGSAVRLMDGRVLLVGGYAGGIIAACEIYDPATGQWSTTGSMALPRTNFTATRLPSGNVLVVGGVVTLTQTDGATAACELYDVASGTWSAAESMPAQRSSHSAVLLRSGKLLIAGGMSAVSNVAEATCVLFDPQSGTWSPTGSLVTAGWARASARLPSGQVVLAGGYAMDMRRRT
jgi:large repetitive protein